MECRSSAVLEHIAEQAARGDPSLSGSARDAGVEFGHDPLLVPCEVFAGEVSHAAAQRLREVAHVALPATAATTAAALAGVLGLPLRLGGLLVRVTGRTGVDALRAQRQRGDHVLQRREPVRSRAESTLSFCPAFSLLLPEFQPLSPEGVLG